MLADLTGELGTILKKEEQISEKDIMEMEPVTGRSIHVAQVSAPRNGGQGGE